MEILIYLTMREILVNNKEKPNTLTLKMAPRRLTRQTIYHTHVTYLDELLFEEETED